MHEFLASITNQKSIIQLFYYGLIGFAINLTIYMAYLLVTYLGGTPKVTMSILYVIGIFVGFWGNRKLTFTHHGNVLAAGVRYSIVQIFGYIINLIILIVMVDKLGFQHQWVQASAIIIVASYLFITFKFFVFRESSLSNGVRE